MDSHKVKVKRKKKIKFFKVSGDGAHRSSTS